MPIGVINFKAQKTGSSFLCFALFFWVLGRANGVGVRWFLPWWGAAMGLGVTLFFAGEIFDDIAEGDHGVALIF